MRLFNGLPKWLTKSKNVENYTIEMFKHGIAHLLNRNLFSALIVNLQYSSNKMIKDTE